MFSKEKSSTLIVKLAGGAAAQLLALMSAIYLRNKNGKEFVLKYYPFSTGTYWPFEINFLLKHNEILSISGKTHGVTSTDGLEIGKIIQTHPLAKKNMSYERILLGLRKLRLDKHLQNLRGEHPIAASRERLQKVTKRVMTVSGGYPMIFDTNVFDEMDQRFKCAGKKSPFSKSADKFLSHYIIIHYRLGDKRAKFSSSYVVGDDGVIDPIVFFKILESIDEHENLNIFVISDEPEIAQSLLSSVSVNAKLMPGDRDIWEDLYVMSQADIFIGSWSQVSQLAAVCNFSNGGKSFLPSKSSISKSTLLSAERLVYYDAVFLPQSHHIYLSNS